MSQENLAEQLHVSRQTISKWETGQSAPDPETIVQLAHLFGVTTDRLLTEEDDPPHPQEPPSASTPSPVGQVPNGQPAPLLDTHVFGRYIFLAVMFLGGVILLALLILAAHWELWFNGIVDIILSTLMLLSLIVPVAAVSIHYVISKCRAAVTRRRSKKDDQDTST